MSVRIDDRWLWLGFGAFLFVAAKGISHGLRQTLDLNQIHDHDLTRAKNETHAEDSISLAGLATLSTSPNPDTANAAISLLLIRFAQSSSATTSLTLHLFSPNPSTRQSAKRVLDLYDRLIPYSAGLIPLNEARVQQLRKEAGQNAAVILMCRAFTRTLERYRQGRGSLRGIADRVEDSVTLVRPNPHLDPWTGLEDVQPSPAVSFLPASRRVESLVDLLADQAAGIQPRASPQRAVSVSEDGDSEPESELSSLAPTSQSTMSEPPVGRRLRLAESSGEAEIRRRRREAMVLFEGGGAIGRDNIIHPRTRTS